MGRSYSRALKKAGYNLATLSDWDAPAYQFSPEHIEIMAQAEHELWRKDQRANGWRYASAEKNLAAKTHPDMVSWEELSHAEQEKNRRLVANIPAFLGRAGFQVVKIRTLPAE